MEDDTQEQVRLSKKEKKQRRKERKLLQQQVEAGLTNGTHADTDSKKKKKSEATAEEPVEQSNAVENGDSRKKKKKREPEPVKVQQPENQEEEEQSAPTEKKKKKKDKKRHREAEEQPQEDELEQTENNNGTHKSKKSKDQTHITTNNNNTNANTTGKVRKNFYSEHPNVKSFTSQQVQQYRADHNMTVAEVTNQAQPKDYKPLRSFEEANFPAAILKECKGFTKPTPIQSQCWPIVLSGRDVVGIAETGSGKTLAFTLPGIVHVLDQAPVTKQSQGPIVLVLAPTRELAMQTAEVAEKMGGACNLRSVCIYGGVPKDPQYKALERGVHFVVATPGRLLDLMNDGACSLSRVTYLVLDEADRMLDMGFEQDVRRILSQITKDRQTLMFSATWPSAIQKLAHEFLCQPVKVTIGSEDLSANHRVKQIVEVVEQHQKDRKLIDLLNKYHASRKNRVLVFALYKKEATRLEEYLRRQRFNCIAIHADKSQVQRSQALEQFKSGEQPLLIATDVAARGLDIPDVEVVINVTFPLTIEDYVHRIGRTGRAGKEGISHTLFTSLDKGRAAELASVLREANQPVPAELLPLCGAGTKKKEHKMYGAHFKETNPFDANAKPTKIKFDDDD